METLANFNTEKFLRDYWQKKPLLIRQALSTELFTLSPSELAGLACEEEIESRLITGTDNANFKLQHGPFSDTTFNTLPEKGWSVLVQAVDHVIPEAAALLEYFRFIPNWRIDDLMVSYAPIGGSAGPHYDNYDVFLIQGAGTRRWKVGPDIGTSPTLSNHKDLRLLEDFQSIDEWNLEPGDLLYLPPRFAHWGISTSKECMTYSVGFRSPTTTELLSEFCDQAISQLDDFQRYEDSNLATGTNPGEITDAAMTKIQQLVLEQFSDKDKLGRWFGQYTTLPKYSPDNEESVNLAETAPLERALEAAESLHRDSAARFSYWVTNKNIYLFVDGNEYKLEARHQPFVQTLCSEPAISQSQISEYRQDPILATVLLALFNQGNLYSDDELFD